MGAVAITRDEHTAADLRRAAAASKDAAAARRMLALALVLEGSPRAGRPSLRDGPADPARLGASLQRAKAWRGCRNRPPGSAASRG